MADLSQLSDEQLSVYRDMLAQKGGSPASEKPQGSFVGNALGTAASDIGGIPSGIKSMATHPIETFKAGTANQPSPQIPESQMPQDAFHRLQRSMGGGPSYNPPGKGMPVSEAAGHMISGAALSALPAAIGKAPALAESAMEHMPQTFNPIPHFGAAARAAAPDVAAGGIKAGAGLAVAQELPSPLNWVMRYQLGMPGLRQVGRGIKAGAEAAKGGTAEEALSQLPTISGPESFKPPAVFGDPAGFAKLPQNVQDAIMRGTQSGTASAPKPALQPRGPEHYGITPKPETVTVHEPPDLRVASPPTAQSGAIPVPEPTVKGAIGKLDVEPHEPYNSYSPSRVERQMTPAETTPERAEYEARVGRLKRAFPLESDQQIRGRADRAIIDKKLNAAGLKKQDFQSMGGQ